MTIQTESRTALGELIELLQEIDERWAGEEWNLHSEADVVGAHRALMHVLESGLVGNFEYNPARPDFRRIVTPSRKLTGDNGDAIYFDAPISADYEYRIRGNLKGAVYFSLTIEVGTEGGAMASHTDGVLNDVAMDIDDMGNFEVFLGGEPRQRNWLALNPGASRVTTRSYFEFESCAAGDPAREPLLLIEALNAGAATAPPTDESVALGIRRVAGFVRSRTLGMPPMAQSEPPAFVSLVPNELPAPVVPGDFGLAAIDAHYSMAPYYLNPDEALVMTGHWPECRFGNVCLWNRFQQTFDYVSRQTSLNRRQTELEADGSYRIVIAHEDPGVANWIDTEGNPLGLVFWRFMLARGEVETPKTEVVKLQTLKAGLTT
jgi:hypothetical protein